MHSADYAVARCLSVRLPNAGILSKRLYVSNFFHRRVAQPTILVFPYQTGWQYSDGAPTTWASNANGYEKITIFDQYLALPQK